MFSYESIINLRDIAVKGYTVRGSKLFTPQTIKGNTSIMIWGAFSYYGFTDLEIIDNGKIDSEVYCEILNKHIPNLMARNPNNQSLLLQENATVHTSIRTSQFINSNGILTIHHPRLSPDLNLIEKVWRQLKFKLKENQFSFLSVDRLKTEVKLIWEEIIGNDELRRIFLTMETSQLMLSLFKRRVCD